MDSPFPHPSQGRQSAPRVLSIESQPQPERGCVSSAATHACPHLHLCHARPLAKHVVDPCWPARPHRTPTHCSDLSLTAPSRGVSWLSRQPPVTRRPPSAKPLHAAAHGTASRPHGAPQRARHHSSVCPSPRPPHRSAHARTAEAPPRHASRIGRAPRGYATTGATKGDGGGTGCFRWRRRTGTCSPCTPPRRRWARRSPSWRRCTPGRAPRAPPRRCRWQSARRGSPCPSCAWPAP